MKKIIALMLLAVLCVSVLASCGGGNDGEVNPVEQVAQMYANSQPTKVVANTTQQFGEKTLNGKYVITVGYVDGKEAAVYEATYDKMRDVASGSGTNIYGPTVTVNETKWYLEGKGVNYNKSFSWKDEPSFAPEKGGISINLDPEIITNYTYEDGKLSFTVAKENTAAVLGEEQAVNADVQVEITNDGASITGITITYTLPADTTNNVEATTVSITVVYTYDLEAISFN